MLLLLRRSVRRKLTDESGDVILKTVGSISNCTKKLTDLASVSVIGLHLRYCISDIAKCVRTNNCVKADLSIGLYNVTNRCHYLSTRRNRSIQCNV